MKTNEDRVMKLNKDKDQFYKMPEQLKIKEQQQKIEYDLEQDRNVENKRLDQR